MTEYVAHEIEYVAHEIEYVAHGILICGTWDSNFVAYGSNLWHMGLEFVAHGFHIPQFCGIWLW
jgi:hypothetical protein